MDALLSERNVIRKHIRELYDKVERKESVDIRKHTLQAKYERLQKLDDSVKFLLTENENISQAEWDQEFEATEEYKDKIVYLLQDFCDQEDINDKYDEKKNMKLPKIVYTQFDGTQKMWLPFWGQFKKIAEEDKFQYLLQSTTGKARTLVESFPPSGKNFTKVIDLLRDRFARQEVLVEHYVRELLNIMIQQLTNKDKMCLSELFDSISRQINALEELNMTRDSYAAMLLPLIESALPSHILIEWERSKYKSSNKSNDGDQISNLDKLMTFLRGEVDIEERVKCAQQGLGNLHLNFRETELKVDNLPTASNLINQNSKIKTVLDNCIFCNKRHSSQDCYKASRMSLKDKKEIIIKNNRCFACLKKSHSARECRYPPKCMICRRSHFVIICPDLPQHKSKKDQKPKKKEESVVESVVHVNSNFKDVEIHMQTLILKISNPKKQGIKIRALLDSGSQRSYLLSKLASDLELPEVGQCIN